MNKVAFLASSVTALVFFLVASPVPASAQAAPSNGQLPFALQGNGSVVPQGPQGPQVPQTPRAPATGVFCIEEMTATFCNVVTGPNINGYGTSTGPASNSAAAGSTSSVPPCPAHPPFNELCD
jgi:hypothetical protein